MHMRVHQPRRQELAAPVDLLRVRLGGDALLADAHDPPVANQHMPVRQRLRLLRRNHRDVLDEHIRSRRRSRKGDQQNQVPGEKNRGN
jgi:hypothetical protein